MISMVQTGALLNTNLTPQNTASADLVGLSTDTKPTGMSVGNGWTYIEMDTGKIYFYNAEDEEWLEFGGNGGGDENIVAPEQEVTLSADPVALTLADGYTVPASTPLTWTVTINGETAEYNAEYQSYVLAIGGNSYALVTVNEGAVYLTTVPSVEAGTYTVKIVEA